MKPTEHKLDSGYVVKCRLVPPSAIGDVIASIPRPVYPTVDLKSVDGHIEHAPALEDTPEWSKWQEDNREYNANCAKEIGDFVLVYGVMAYRQQGPEQDWHTKSPSNWHVPTIMHKFGVVDTDDEYVRWLQFIKYELIATDDDRDTVDEATSVKAVTPSEVDAATVPFDSKSE